MPELSEYSRFAWALAIGAALADPIVARRRGEAAYLRARTFHDEPAMIDAWERLLTAELERCNARIY